ncbi:unnamed protein product [Linum trigynum]|uniref:Uncharacterized protein n=1 Tax=Linum trigynum TaxID=586398 RepID=A0AAV2EPD7_9ROSI
MLIMWLAIRDRLNTNDKLKERGVINKDRYALCDAECDEYSEVTRALVVVGCKNVHTAVADEVYREGWLMFNQAITRA